MTKYLDFFLTKIYCITITNELKRVNAKVMLNNLSMPHVENIDGYVKKID